MKQILQSYKSGELWIADVPTPLCGRKEVKVRVESSLVSAGTEKRIIDLAKSSLLQKARKRPDQVKRIIQKIKAEGLLATYNQVLAKLDSPVSLGYSCAGRIVEVGRDVRSFRVGQRVACAGFGYASHAEYVTVPENLTTEIPSSLTYEHSSFCTLGAIAMQAIRQAQVSIGENIGIIGLGLIGNLVVQIANAAGARVIGSDIDVKKQELALASGAEFVDDNLKNYGLEISGGKGLDTIIIAAGDNTSNIINSCPTLLRHRGKIIVLGFVGLNCPHQEFYNKELELKMSMSYGPGRYDKEYEELGHDYPYAFVRWTEQRNMASFLHLLKSEKVDVSNLISHRFSFSDSLDAYKLIQSKKDYIGIILKYNSNDQGDTSEIILNENDQPVKPNINVSLVGGGGFMSGIVCPIIKKLKINVKSCVSKSGQSALKMAKFVSAEKITTNIGNCLADNSITHLIIATRFGEHFDIAKQCIGLNKKVHIEKPLCCSQKELKYLHDKLIRNSTNYNLHVGFNRRYSPISQIIFEQLRSTNNKPILINYRINAGVLPETHWFYEKSGGRLLAEGCHFINLCLYYIQQKVVKINCSQIGNQSEQFDSYNITMTFEDGSIANILYSGQGDRSFEKEMIEIYQNSCCMLINDWKELLKFANGKKSTLYRGMQDKGWHTQFKQFLGLEKFPRPLEWSEIYETHYLMFKAIRSAIQND